jgi:hypothetical protein
VGHPPSACVRLTLAGGGRPPCREGLHLPQVGTDQQQGFDVDAQRRPGAALRSSSAARTGRGGSRQYVSRRTSHPPRGTVRPAGQQDRRRRCPVLSRRPSATRPARAPRCLGRARGRCGRAQTRARSKMIRRLTVRAAAQPERLPFVQRDRGSLGDRCSPGRGLAVGREFRSRAFVRLQGPPRGQPAGSERRKQGGAARIKARRRRRRRSVGLGQQLSQVARRRRARCRARACEVALSAARCRRRYGSCS